MYRPGGRLRRPARAFFPLSRGLEEDWQMEGRVLLSSIIGPTFQLASNAQLVATESVNTPGLNDTVPTSVPLSAGNTAVTMKSYPAAVFYAPGTGGATAGGSFTNFAQNMLTSPSSSTSNSSSPGISIATVLDSQGTIPGNPPTNQDQSQYDSATISTNSINWNVVDGSTHSAYSGGVSVVETFTIFYQRVGLNVPVQAKPISSVGPGTSINFSSTSTGISIKTNGPDMLISVPQQPNSSPVTTTYSGFFDTTSSTPEALTLVYAFNEPSGLSSESISYNTLLATDPNFENPGAGSDDAKLVFNFSEFLSPLPPAAPAPPGPSNAPVTVDNHDANYSQAGTWSHITGSGGYRGDYAYAAPSGTSASTSTATWQATGLPPGPQDVQVTWAPGSNRADNATYLIYDGSTQVAAVRVNQQQPPRGAIFDNPETDIPASTTPYPTSNNPLVPFQSLGVYNITSGNLSVVLENGNNADGYVIADALRVAPPQSDAFITDDQQPNVSQTGQWFSTATVTASTAVPYYGGFGGEFSYSLPSGGSASTSTTTWQSPGLFPDSYEVDATWVPSTSYASNAAYQIYDGSTLLGTVVVNQQLAPQGPNIGGVPFQSLGLFNATSGVLRVVLGNGNNANGYVAADAVRFAPSIIDNKDPRYSETQTSAWTNLAGYSSSYDGDFNFAYALSVSGTSASATWQMTNQPAGNYEVDVTWLAGSNRATNAPYQIYDGDTLIQTVLVNQQVTPSGASYDGIPFLNLGVFHFTSGRLRVVLSNNANGDVIADAVRFASSN